MCLFPAPHCSTIDTFTRPACRFSFITRLPVSQHLHYLVHVGHPCSSVFLQGVGILLVFTCFHLFCFQRFSFFSSFFLFRMFLLPLHGLMVQVPLFGYVAPPSPSPLLVCPLHHNPCWKFRLHASSMCLLLIAYCLLLNSYHICSTGKTETVEARVFVDFFPLLSSLHLWYVYSCGIMSAG